MNPLVVVIFVLAGICLLVALFKFLKPARRWFERRSVVKFMALLREDEAVYEADIAKYGKVLNFIEEGLRTGLSGQHTEVDGAIVWITPDGWQRYSGYVRHAQDSLVFARKALADEALYLEELSS